MAMRFAGVPGSVNGIQQRSLWEDWMDDYYDHHPTVSLPRAVALTGFFGSGVAEVAGIVSRRTGIAAVELDRWIEHEAGCSLSALALEGGVATMRKLEARLLPRAVSQQPAPIIALGDGALLQRRNLRLIERRAELIYLRADLHMLLPRVRNDVERYPGSMYPFLFSPPRTVDDLAPLFEERQRGYRRAAHVIDVGSRSAMDVASQLLDLLRAQDLAGAH
jgi:shikimate kinase